MGETAFHPLLAIIAASIPLLAFLILTFREKAFSKDAGKIASGFTFVAFLHFLYFFYKIRFSSDDLTFQTSMFWFSPGEQDFSVRIYVDAVAVAMLLMVNLIAFLVHWFSTAYMKEDANYARYFAYLSLFTFSMNGLLLTANLLVIYLFWELVGLSSYLLIGFWQHKEAARKAAKKAFVLNRVGDAGFVAAIIALYANFGTLDLLELMEMDALNHLSAGAAWLVGGGLLLGAIAKSAQFPLAVWLPDAMEGPTPVSALIHAATMVAAGVYLLVRCHFLFSGEVLVVVLAVGTITAFMAAYAALSQRDIKKVLAYSTISQLGYMLAAVGAGAVNAAFFHLITHAFFKAGLFLAAGSIIHSLHQAAHKTDASFDAQDMALMGGLRKKLPLTFGVFVFCGFSLAGIPLFSGFLSKDAILAGMVNFASLQTGFWWAIFPFLGFLTALMTAFYLGRQVYLVFLGENRLKDDQVLANITERQASVKLPIGVLGMLSIGFVFSWNPFAGTENWLMTGIGLPTTAHAHAGLVALASAILAVGGLAAAYMTYSQPTLLHKIRSIAPEKGMLLMLSQHFWFLDHLFEKTLKKALLASARGLKKFDASVVDYAVNFFGAFHVIAGHILAWLDKYLVDGIVSLLVWGTGKTGQFTRTVQGGKVQSHIAWAMLGLVGLVVWIVWT